MISIVVVGWVGDIEELLEDANVLRFVCTTLSIRKPIVELVVKFVKPRGSICMTFQGSKESWSKLISFETESPWNLSGPQVFVISDQAFPNVFRMSNEPVFREGLDHTDLSA